MQCSGNQESPAFRHGECQDHAGLLFGDLFIAGHDTEGDIISIDRFDIMPLRWILARHMLMNKARKEAMQHD